MNDNEQKWIDQLKHEHCLYKKHLKALEDELLEYKEAARSEADEVNRLQTENKKLGEALEKIVTIRRKDGNDNEYEGQEVYIAREALKEVG
jgi:hypothetical protein